jgi:hypothetical protein
VLGASDGCVARIVRDDWRRRAAQDRKALLVEMPNVPAPAPNADYPKGVPRATILPRCSSACRASRAAQCAILGHRLVL